MSVICCCFVADLIVKVHFSGATGKTCYALPEMAPDFAAGGYLCQTTSGCERKVVVFLKEAYLRRRG